MKIGTPHPVLAKVEADNPFFGIISDAYRVFDVPKPASTEVCESCCMYADIEADFFTPAIEDLPLAYVQDWYSAAYEPSGIAKATWAYLLPRLLEILASGNELANVGLEVSLQRFETGVPSNWNAEQWTVLDAFQRLYLRLQVERAGPFANSADSIDDALCMFGLGGWPVDQLAGQLIAGDARALARRLHDDWSLEHYRECGAIWITPFWDPPGRERIWAFYTSQVLHDRIAALALAEDTEPGLAEMAFRVASVIDAHQGRDP